MAVDPITGTVFGGIMDALGSATDTQNQINQDYTNDRNSAAQNYTTSVNAMNANVAQTQNARDILDWQSNNSMDNLYTQTAINMFDRNYGVANLQAGYDKYAAEFGDMQDNVYATMKTLSTASMNAQTNEAYQESLVYEMDNLQQDFTEMGINPKSGFYKASQIALTNQNRSENIKANRNTEYEVASMKQDYMNQRAQNPYFSRAVDFDEGILTQDQKEGLVTDSRADTRTYQNAADYEVRDWDIEQATVEKAEREKFLGIF